MIDAAILQYQFLKTGTGTVLLDPRRVVMLQDVVQFTINRTGLGLAY